MTPPNGKQHTSELIYSTALSRALHLHSANSAIHLIPSLPRPLEFLIFLCGYAFNPVVVPFWVGLIHVLGGDSEGSLSFTRPPTSITGELPSLLRRHRRALSCSASYVATVLLTLVATEVAKASFATTRPGKHGEGTTRRYGALVSSLKSKHSFPSGDCAQAANLCIFLWTYVPAVRAVGGKDAGGDACIWLALFGAFLPGVCFARVYYHCHWIEDCIGGVVLSSLLHWVLVPPIEAFTRESIEKLV